MYIGAPGIDPKLAEALASDVPLQVNGCGGVWVGGVWVDALPMAGVCAGGVGGGGSKRTLHAYRACS